jgi:hypothetical protein
MIQTYIKEIDFLREQKEEMMKQNLHNAELKQEGKVDLSQKIALKKATFQE